MAPVLTYNGSPIHVALKVNSSNPIHYINIDNLLLLHFISVCSYLCGLWLKLNSLDLDYLTHSGSHCFTGHIQVIWICLSWYQQNDINQVLNELQALKKIVQVSWDLSSNHPFIHLICVIVDKFPMFEILAALLSTGHSMMWQVSCVTKVTWMFLNLLHAAM